MRKSLHQSKNTMRKKVYKNRRSSPVLDVAEKVQPEMKIPAGYIKNDETGDLNLNLDFVKGTHVLVGTPCYGGLLTDQYFVSMMEMRSKFDSLGIPFSVATIRNESLITRARNAIVAMFLNDPTYTHLMFIDADIQFNPDHVIRMLAMDVDVVAGAYPMKGVNWSAIKASDAPAADIAKDGGIFVVNNKADSNGMINTYVGMVEVLDAGTGFFLIKRSAMDKMTEAYKHLKYVPDATGSDKVINNHYALFDCMLENGRYLSEDYTFCRRFQQIGGQIWVDPNVVLSHVGSFTYQGDPRKFLLG